MYENQVMHTLEPRARGRGHEKVSKPLLYRLHTPRPLTFLKCPEEAERRPSRRRGIDQPLGLCGTNPLPVPGAALSKLKRPRLHLWEAVWIAGSWCAAGVQ